MSIIAQAASSTTGTNYTLIVTSGSGDGVYASGSVVTITADAPAGGQIFSAWTGATVGNAASGSTTIVMNANHTVVATYTAAPAATYTLAVVNGTGDGNYVAGHVQAIAADAAPSGQLFDAWTGATVADAADPTTTLTMPASAATVTATYVNGPSYALTVNSGTGDGTYLNGTVVTITADAPATNKIFDAWTGDAVADASKPSTTITMTAAKAVTATYEDTTGILYTLTVVGGTGSGNYLNGTVVMIAAAAAPTGQVFDAWTGDTVASPSSASTTITMGTAPASVTATYTNGPSYVLTVTNGTGDGTYLSGTVVTITADAPTGGNVFDAWTGASVADAAASSTTITVTGTTTVVATYTAAATFTLTVISGTGGGNFAALSVHAIVANAPATGKVFSAWTGDTGALTNPAAASTNATMPSAPVTVTATYVDGPSYALTVTNGSGDGTYLTGTVVTITADAPSAGQVFNGWTGTAVADSTKASTTITVTGVSAVTATYVTSPPAVYTLTVTNGTGDGSYVAGAVRSIVADAPATGRVFSAWTGDTAYVANTAASTTTVTMPAGPVSVTATYVDGPFYTLTVNSGTGDGSYLVGSVRTIVADAPATGKVFSVWTGGTVASASSPSTTVTMPASNVTVTATYVDNPVTYTLVVTAGSGDGNYSAAAVVPIVAESPNVGQQFSAWTGGGGAVASPSSASTSVTMPAAALTVTATYTAIPVTGTYFVAKNGSDSNPGTQAQPFLTINKAASVAVAGNTVRVRTGTYLETLHNPSCTGSSGNPLTFSAYPGEVVWMSPTSAAFVVYLNGSQQYLVFDGINMDGQLCTYGALKVEASGGHNPHHITVTNAELVGPTSGANTPQIVTFDAQFAGATGGNVLSDCLLLQMGGDDFCHAVYIKSGGNTVSGCDISDVPGAGVHIYATYTATGNQILGNTIHDLRTGASGQRHWGIIIANNAVDTVITSNEVSGVPNNGGSSVGLYDFAGDGSTYHDNNVHNCAGVGVRIEIYAVDATLTDNTSVNNTVAQYQNAGTGTTSTGNSWD